MSTKNKKTIGFKMTFTMTLFGIIILLGMYLFQNIYLNYYYRVYKIEQVNEIGDQLALGVSNIDSYLNEVSKEKDVCIKLVTDFGSKLYNGNTKGCVLESPSREIEALMNKMYLSDKDSQFYRINNPSYNTKSFLFGIETIDGYIFINSQLESMDATNKVLHKQLIYLLIIVIFLSIIIAYFLSHSIAKPIQEITKKAKKMGNGDLEVNFESSDISELDELASTLNYAKEEMVKTDDYRRDLMANVGHDLKTPLTLIRSYAEMVRDITYKDDEKRSEHLNVIISETDRLNSLVDDILELSKLEANAEKLNIESYDLIKEIKGIIEKFEILELTENYNFIYSGPNEAIVKADKKKINQVIYNLVGNAINYTGKDMTIYINVSEVKSGFMVEVIDTGVGIDNNTIKHVWDRYYKTEKKHKRNKVGTGLGLSIVREILEAHGFKYGVKSTLNKGTNFYLIVKK